jgi:hypothetical protein
MAAAFDRAESQRVDDQPNLGTGFDGEQPGNSVAHCHWLIKRHANRAVPPFPD